MSGFAGRTYHIFGYITRVHGSYYLFIQGPSILDPMWGDFNLDEMSEEERNTTLELYGDYSYSLNIHEVVM